MTYQPANAKSPFTGATFSLAEKTAQVLSVLESHGDPTKSDRLIREMDRAKNGAIVLDNIRCISSERDVLWRFGHYRSLAIRIAEEGFQTAGELDDPDVSDPGISVGPNGRLYWMSDGVHRSVIAAHFKLTAVPVTLRTVHHGWLSSKVAVAAPASVLQRVKDSVAAPDEPNGSGAVQWLSRVDRSMSFPEHRPDMHGLNSTIDIATWQHHYGYLDDAVNTWELAPKAELPPYANVLRARLDVDRADLDAAELRCGRVISIWPDHISARMLLADIADRRNDVGAALHQLEVVLATDPLYPWALRLMLRIAMRSGDSVLAQRALDGLAVDAFDRDRISSTQARIDRLD